MILPTFEAFVWFPAFYLGPAMMALGLTLLLELSVALAMGWRTRNDLAGVAAVSIMTNPFFVLCVYVLLLVSKSLSPWPLVLLFMIVLEIVIVLVEWRLLRWALKKDSRKTILLSAAMNAASFAAGLVVFVGL
jgi:O-antigen/teichoic acid export membrane protein